MALIRSFIRALGYFTIVPAGAAIDGPPKPDDIALLPLVGACVGLTAGSFAYASSFVLPRRVAAAVAYAAPIALTGALHLDGFLDVCDAAFASVDGERRREILRDPRHGTYALAGGILHALAANAALTDCDPRTWPLTLTLAETVARLAALTAARRVRPQSEGTAAAAFARAPKASLINAQLCAVLIAGAAGGKRQIASSCAAFAIGQPVAASLAKRFDGELSGDAYGFIISTVHLAYLLSAVSFARRRTHE